MKKIIQESVSRVDGRLSAILEGYASKLEEVFTIDLQEACKKLKAVKEEEDEKDEDDEYCEGEEHEKDEKEDEKEDDKEKAKGKGKEKVEENVRKNSGKEEVTFRKTKTPDKEAVSKFSKDGNKTDGDSGYEEVKPSSETPDKQGESARKKNSSKDNETVPGKEGNSGKPVKESYGEFKKDKPTLDSTTFTKDKKGTEGKAPGFDETDPSGKTYDSGVEFGETGELAKDSKLDDTHDMGFKEKPKYGDALSAKKKAFPSKKPKITGTPGTVKD